jgi:5-methyltetrahydropteroyltriglutamate--homocysteine methyltransferase
LAQRTTPPFRADHVGSLLRPPELAEARERSDRGELTASELRAIEDDSIRDVVRMQEEVGLQAATDGEYRRRSWNMDFIFQIAGIREIENEQQAVEFHREQGTVVSKQGALLVDAPIKLEGTIFGEDFIFLQEMTTSAIAKQTIPSPSMVHHRGGRAAIDAQVYPDEDGFWEDLTQAYRDELNGLYELGCRYLQFDDVSLGLLNDENVRRSIAERGEDADHQHLNYIRHLNEVVADRPDDMQVTTHLCRGNYRSSWIGEAGYDFVAEALFGELDVDGFFLEYDDERSGGFEPLRFVPEGKMVVLGLVTSKRGELEDPDHLKRRIEEASKFVSIDQLCLSPQCGFASTIEGNELSAEQQRAKLELIVETAGDVWG